MGKNTDFTTGKDELNDNKAGKDTAGPDTSPNESGRDSTSGGPQKPPGMSKAKKRRIFFLALVAIITAFVVVDALKLFDDRPYVVVPHGNHVHYVPHDRDPDVPLSAFPTEKPRPGERILPDGRVVRE